MLQAPGRAPQSAGKGRSDAASLVQKCSSHAQAHTSRPWVLLQDTSRRHQREQRHTPRSPGESVAPPPLNPHPRCCPTTTTIRPTAQLSRSLSLSCPEHPSSGSSRSAWPSACSSARRAPRGSPCPVGAVGGRTLLRGGGLARSERERRMQAQASQRQRQAARTADGARSCQPGPVLPCRCG